MTQQSYFWNGTANGDAIESPYTAALLSTLLKSLLSTDGGYVLPNVANYLAVTTAGPSMSVDVNTGQAFVYGHYYKNTASVNLTLSVGHTKFDRWDRVGLLVDDTAQTVRLVVVEGVPSALPSIPEYPTCKNFMSLARVYVPAGATTVSSAYIHDERAFAHNVYHQNNGSIQNDWEDPAWRLDLLTTAYTKTFLTSTVGNVDYTMYILCKSVNMSSHNIVCGATTITVPPTRDFIEIIIRENATGYKTLTFSELDVQEITLAQGFIPAKPTYDTEGYLFFTPFSVATSNAASTGVVLIELSDFFTILPHGIRALNVYIRSRDSGSAASSTTQVSVRAPVSNVVYMTSWNAGRTNDKWEYASGLVFIEHSNYLTEDKFAIELDIVASGAGTTEYDVYLVGVVV